jgi:ubiquinone biosynthesis protein UbiJ
MLPLKMILRFLRHVLTGSSGAREALAKHSGKVICVEAPLGPIVVHITDDGFVEPYTGDEQPSLIVKVNPDVALNWLKDGEVGSKGVRIEGDAQFASDLSRIVGMLDWDYEEDMAQVFGDVIAHRLGEMLRGFGRWMSGARESMKASVSDYLTEESRLLVTPVGVEMFIRGVDEVSDGANRLEKRVSEMTRMRRDN